MKKVLFVILAMILCIALLTSCNLFKNDKICKHKWQRIENLNEYTAVEKCSKCENARQYTISDNITVSGDESGLKMLRYRYDGYGFEDKEIDTGNLGNAIISCLSALQETGDIIPKISDIVVNINNNIQELPVERGTLWIECGNIGMFRINSQITEICKVETHLGEGKVLKMTDTLRTLLIQAWYYYPNDYWKGTYENGEVTLQQVYKTDSAVECVEIESIHIENKKFGSDNNQIKLRIRAGESKNVSALLSSYQSNDNLGSCEEKELKLVKGTTQTLNFKFYGFNYSYFISIKIDNTVILLTVKIPKE